MTHLFEFIGVAVLVIVVPGPDTAITVRNTLFGNRVAGTCTAAGIAAGQTIWALATSVGLVALLIASEPLFLAVKYAGAAYLVYLGLQSLYRAVATSRTSTGHGIGAVRSQELSASDAFRQGLLSNLGNPKMAAFFMSLLPQFVNTDGASFTGSMLLGALFATMTFGWLAAYAAVVARFGNYVHRPKVRRTLEGISGSLLVGLGLRMAGAER